MREEVMIEKKACNETEHNLNVTRSRYNDGIRVSRGNKTILLNGDIPMSGTISGTRR